MIEYVLARCHTDINKEHRHSRSLPYGTALALACYYGHVHCAKFLIGLGCRVDQVLQNGQTALQIAIQRDDARTVECLLQANAYPNQRVRMITGYKSVLSLAISEKRDQVVKLLLTYGASVDQQTEWNREHLYGKLCKQEVPPFRKRCSTQELIPLLRLIRGPHRLCALL
eukprot:TRINITY_DN12371_c0_g1_i2.p3 TRINITY_DN12371_c0_g1~~TRINITY_DN12371_c0_g1_i2.p3  ORF type:complete len:170 (+),score=0.97 TRINITY_DN12371_c0_g1_i2:1488-1997(+)